MARTMADDVDRRDPDQAGDDPSASGARRRRRRRRPDDDEGRDDTLVRRRGRRADGRRRVYVVDDDDEGYDGNDDPGDEPSDDDGDVVAPWDRDPDAPVPRVVEAAIVTDHIDPDAAKVVKRLVRHGHVAFLVGGSVRDLLLRRRPKDFDVATSARPNQVRALFRNCRIIGRRFRLAHILFGGGKIIETATFRRDPGADPLEDPEIASRLIPAGLLSTDRDDAAGGDDDDDDRNGASALRRSPMDSLVPPTAERDDVLIRQDNVFGEPHEDAIRRDFTINGLFYDVHRGEVIDYVGGLADLEARVVRTIGSPSLRLREDPVRILRAIKFSARLDLGIDPDLYDAMVATREDLQRAAPPRVLEEVLRLLRGGAAHRSVYLALETGVLAVVLPEVAALLDDLPLPGFWARLDAIDQRQREGRLPSDAVLLAALLLDALDEELRDVRDVSAAFEDFMSGVMERFAVPRRLKDRLRAVVVAQRRLARGRLGSLPRRDFFADAATLYAIDLESRGVPLPEWARNPENAAPEAESSGRRRRRRRRRR